MALITKVKAGSVSSLSDARYFAGMGVDWLGFDVNPKSVHYVSLDLYKSIAGWVTGPKRVIELTHETPTETLQLLETYVPDLVEIDLSSFETVRQLTDLPIIAQVDLDQTQPPLESIKQAAFISVNSTSPLKHKEIIQKIAQLTDVLLYISPDELNYKNLLTLLPISGLCLKGSPETQVGIKDYSYAELLESLEEY